MALTDLEQVIVRHLEIRDGGWQFGRDGEIRASTFIDLMSAAHIDASLAILAKALSRHISSGPESTVEPFALVGPKRGNSLLIRETARLLGVSSGYVKEQPLFGFWLEGVIPPRSYVVVADDISSDGELLMAAVEQIRMAGHRVSRAYVLVDRREGDASTLLKQYGISLSPLMELGDDDLYHLKALARMEQ